MTTDTPTVSHQAPGSTPSRGLPKWLVPAALAVAGLAVGVAAGIGIGLASSDPTTSDEYQALQSQQETVAADAQRVYDNAQSIEGQVREREAVLDQQAAELQAQEAAVAAREAAVTAVEQQVAANSIEEGTWTVGVDIEPGTYRTAQPVVGDCYWGIYRSGSNGSDIIDNDIVQGGFPTVTLSEGQDFTNNRCGTFVKQ